MRTWKAGGCNNRGFTLVELVMVMLVIGIVAAITMPRVGGMLDRQNMRRTINVVRGSARYLQARAALTKRTYRLTFDLDTPPMGVVFSTMYGAAIVNELIANSGVDLTEVVIRLSRASDAGGVDPYQEVRWTSVLQTTWTGAFDPGYGIVHEVLSGLELAVGM